MSIISDVIIVNSLSLSLYLSLSLSLQEKEGQLFARLSRGTPLEHVRVQLGKEEVKVSRHDIVYEDILATKVI